MAMLKMREFDFYRMQALVRQLQAENKSLRKRIEDLESGAERLIEESDDVVVKVATENEQLKRPQQGLTLRPRVLHYGFIGQGDEDV